MKFGHMILRKIFNSVATRCQILRLKCTKFDFGWRSAPDPTGGAYSAHPDSLAGFKGLLLRQGKGSGRKLDGDRGGVGGKGYGGREKKLSLIHI